MILLRTLVFTLGAVLVYVLYLPSANAPERFLEQMRTEHALNLTFWGEDAAHRILGRSLSLYARQDDLVPAAFAPVPGVAVTEVNAAAARQMSDVVERLLHNRYAQGLDALVLLAAYRLSVVAQWLPLLAGFVSVACFDGYIVRIIRSKEFIAPSPLRFALCAFGATLALALTLLLAVVPVGVDPLLLGCVPLLLGALVACATRDARRAAAS